MKSKVNKAFLDKIYKKYNKKDLVHPDPLEFLYNYKNIRDREIVGLIGASLAYGRVHQILKSVTYVLNIMGASPYNYILKTSDNEIKNAFINFKHRFNTGKDIAFLLKAIRSALLKYNSLENCFLSGYSSKDKNVIPALANFINILSSDKPNYLLPDPLKNSACKRLHLYLRWMVRSDEVDPGGWNKIPKSKLIIPLDTHMHNISQKFGFTKRKQANLQTTLEISKAFSNISPEDPTKYDFSLTRFGIRNDMNIKDILQH